MTPRPKQIVIDASAFIGIKLDELCHFAKHHFLVAPGVLLYECATSPDRQQRKLLPRYEKLIREGACCCLRRDEFVQWEAHYCRPYPLFLATAEATTERIRRGDIQLDEVIKPTDAHRWECSCTREARERYVDLSEIAKRHIVQNCADVREEIKAFPLDRLARLRYILNLINTHFDIHGMATRSVQLGLIECQDQFCLSDEWMTWHRMRLASAIAVEYYYKSETGGVPSGTTPEHDDQDGEYVLLLSRADAIITGEKNGLVPTLARAAFPEKDVFSSLEAVPESYRCDWAGL